MKKNIQYADMLKNNSVEFISPAQAAMFLGVHINTIYNYIKMDILTAYRFNDDGNKIFIRKDEIIKKLVPINPEEYRVQQEKKVLYDSFSD